MQMDQELGLILGKSNAKHVFTMEWSTKYVPAIISYGEKLQKQSITSMISLMKPSGMGFSCMKVYIKLHGVLFCTDETS